MKNNRAFHLLVFGQTFANMGDILYTIAVVSSVFTLTDSALAASLSPVIMTLGGTLSSFFLPLLLKRIELVHLLKTSQGCKTLLLTLFAFYLSLQSTQLNILLILAFVALISFFDGCAEPINRSLIPQFVRPKDLIRANSLYQSMLQIISIGSWAIGSSLLLFFSTQTLIFINIAFYLIATFTFWKLPTVSSRSTQMDITIKKQTLLSGWQTIFQSPIIRTIAGIYVLENVANATWISAIVLVFVKEVLHVSENWWGYINATYFLGAVLGSLLIYRLAPTVENNTFKTIFFGALFGGIVTLLVSFTHLPLLVLLYSVLIGVLLQVKDIPQATVLQKNIPVNQLANVYASLNILNTGVASLATLIVSAIADRFGVIIIFQMSGALLCLIATIVYHRRNHFLS